jgi:hypothetical protein
MVSKVKSLCMIRVLYRHCPVCHLHLLGMPSRENTDTVVSSRILPINLIWSDSTSSMTQSFCESISSDGGGPGMMCFVESLSVRVVPVFLDKVDHTPRLPYSLIWCPGREDVTLSRRPLACMKVPKFLKVLDKKKLGLFCSACSLTR